MLTIRSKKLILSLLFCESVFGGPRVWNQWNPVCTDSARVLHGSKLSALTLAFGSTSGAESEVLLWCHSCTFCTSLPGCPSNPNGNHQNLPECDRMWTIGHLCWHHIGRIKDRVVRIRRNCRNASESNEKQWSRNPVLPEMAIMHG